MIVESLAKLENNFRAVIASALPPKVAVKLYSSGRKQFMAKLVSSVPAPYAPPAQLARTLWGIKFNSPLFNAAGMFKNGEGYDVTAAQGAGAYLSGTTTFNPREGNSKEGVSLAFAPYPRSHAASNWLGLPNDGDEAVAKRLKNINRVSGCPVGASIMGSPNFDGQEKLEKLIAGMKFYREAGVDFLEINESCPNTEHGKNVDQGLEERLEYISRHFLSSRLNSTTLPVIVKFSTDAPLTQIPSLIDTLLKFGFDGINFGNTSTRYTEIESEIAPAERKLYNYFTSTFGGGVSGKPLKKPSLERVKAAATHLNLIKPNREFHIIRAGGVENAADVTASLEHGAALVEWFTGYFEKFSEQGHQLYKRLYSEL